MVGSAGQFEAGFCTRGVPKMCQIRFPFLPLLQRIAHVCNGWRATTARPSGRILLFIDT